MTPRLRLTSWLALALALCVGPALADEIMIYHRGKPIRHDAEFGEDLHEVTIETWDCRTGALVREEKVEAYYHLYEEAEIITPRAIDERCRQRFVIERGQDGKYFFRGARAAEAASPQTPATPATPTPPVGTPPAPAAEPPPSPEKPTEDEALDQFLPKVEQATRQVVKVDPDAEDSATQRRRILNDALKAGLDDLTVESTRKVARHVAALGGLSDAQRFYALRSFGWERYFASPERRARLDQAIEFYRESIMVQPTFSSGYYQLGLCYEEKRDADGVIESYGRALLTSNSTARREKYGTKLLEVMAHLQPTTKLPQDRFEALRVALASIQRACRDGDGARAQREVDDVARPILEGAYGETMTR